MASRPRCETISLEFRDLQATTMSLDSTGQYALLAGRKYLGVLDLNIGTGDLLVRVPYGGKYEISGTQWSSSHSHANVLAVASGQRCDIFELTDGAELKSIQKLKCHSRVITDLDWSCLSPNLLATSSFDSYVHIWDIRVSRCTGSEKPQQPQISLSAIDGASQVRWNKWKNETLASCDGGHVKIWDIRSPGNSPAEYIAAHSMKINGLEWMSTDTVITAAQDHTVKFNRTAPNPAKYKGPCLNLKSAVWRARPTPFGRGLLTQCVPLLRRDSGILCLWDWKRFNYQTPIFTFQANDILEFGWKTSYDSTSTTSNTLITWSRDQILRVWTLPSHIIALCGEKDSSTSTIGDGDRRGSFQKNPLNGDNKIIDDGMLLLSDDDDDEFGESESHGTNNEHNCCSNANTDHDNDNTSEDFTTTSFSSRFKNHHQTNGNSKKSESISYSNGSSHHNQQQQRKNSLTNYNSNNFTSSSSISKRDEVLKSEFECLTANKSESLIIEQMEVERGLLRFSWRTDPKAGRCAVVVLVTFSHSYPITVPQFLVTSSTGSEVDNSTLQKILKQAAQQCTRKKEPCLHNCINQFASYMNLIKPEISNDFLAFPTRGVSNVPFPRTSGARFCSVGVLICFGRPPYLRRVKMNTNAGTPRSLSALGPFLSQLQLNSDENQGPKRRSRRTEKKAGVVTIFDVGKLLPFSRELASSYHVLPSRSQSSMDRQSICLENEKKALSMNLTRVAHSWQAASIIAKYADRSYQLKKAEAENFDASTSSLVSSSELYGDDEDVNWFYYHPLARKLINSIIQHHAIHGDVQTAASIACVFTETPNNTSSTLCTTNNNNNNMHKSEKAVMTATSSVTTTKSPLNKKSSYLKSSTQSQAINNNSSSNSYATYQASSTEQAQLQLASPTSNRNTKNGQSKPQTGQPKKFSVPKWWTKGSSPYHNYHTVHGSDTLHGTVINPLTDSFFRQHRSNSWSDSLDDTKAIQASSMYDLQQQSNNNGDISIGDSNSSLSSHGQSTRRNSLAIKRSILDPNMSRLYDNYKAQYAEILYRWGHLHSRAEVLKCLTHERYDSDFLLKQGVSFSIHCKTCHSPSSRGFCHKCKRHSIVCSLCHIPIKGLSTCCLSCGHGGHVECILRWFKRSNKCPTGCTCNCIDNVTNFKAI